MMQNSDWVSGPQAESGQERLVIYVNPTAGGGRAGRLWHQDLRGLRGVSHARVIVPSDARCAESSLDRALTHSVERVIAIGGDGTAHLVANRLLAAEDRRAEAAYEAAQIFNSMPPFDLDGESFPATAATFSLRRNVLFVAA